MKKFSDFLTESRTPSYKPNELKIDATKQVMTIIGKQSEFVTIKNDTIIFQSEAGRAVIFNIDNNIAKQIISYLE